MLHGRAQPSGAYLPAEEQRSYWCGGGLRLRLRSPTATGRPASFPPCACGMPCLCSLRRGGYRALFAGGWVRDQFLGRNSYDIDIATNADPLQAGVGAVL